MHAGKRVPLLPHLLEGLEYYFSITLSRVLHDLQRNTTWSVNDSFEHRRMVFEYTLRQAERNASALTVDEVLQESRHAGNALLWPPLNELAFVNLSALYGNQVQGVLSPIKTLWYVSLLYPGVPGGGIVSMWA